ncbi:MAG: hypothetical protein JOZ02_11025 [Acidobacteria bacterium]|nr:hypothetical protein [Acidobacteriota bacterium]
MGEFDRYRAEMNERLLGSGHLGIKRFCITFEPFVHTSVYFVVKVRPT